MNAGGLLAPDVSCFSWVVARSVDRHYAQSNKVSTGNESPLHSARAVQREPKHTGTPASGKSGAQGSGSSGSCRLTTTFAMIRVRASGAAPPGEGALAAEAAENVRCKEQWYVMASKNAGCLRPSLSSPLPLSLPPSVHSARSPEPTPTAPLCACIGGGL